MIDFLHWPNLVHDKVDVIAAMSGDVSIRAAIRASSTIPVVFITGSDPVQTGLVASLGRPGGNNADVVGRQQADRRVTAAGGARR